MRIVAFVGPKGCGKDTAANAFIKNGKARQKISFAGPLKEVCASVTKLEEKYFSNPQLKEKPLENPITADRRFWRKVKQELVKHLPEVNEETGLVEYNIDRASITGLENRTFNTPRELLQQVGTDFIRNKVLEDWHVKAAFADQNLSKFQKGRIYCVTDARFYNEYSFLEDKFGDQLKVYYIDRPECEEELQDAKHPSEKEILKLKEVIPEENIVKNDGSEEEFIEKVLQLDVPEASGSSSNKTKKTGFVYGPAR